MSGATIAAQAGFTLLFAMALVGWFTRRAHDPKEVDAWARSHGLPITAVNQATITYYVRLTITLRVIGAVGGLVLGALFDDATGLDTSAGPGFWTWIAIGWVTGSCWAAFRLTRSPAGARPVASLTPRRVRDYLPDLLVAAPAVGALAVVATATVGLLIGDPGPPTPGGVAPGVPLRTDVLLGAAASAMAVAALALLACRAIVARPQPARHPELLAADDAIRSSALHHLTAGTTAALLLVASQLAYGVLYPHPLPLGLRAVVPVALAALALVVWGFTRAAWRVRRASPQAAAAR